MKHAELLRDPASIERGNHLIELCQTVLAAQYKHFQPPYSLAARVQEALVELTPEELADPPEAASNFGNDNPTFEAIGRRLVEGWAKKLDVRYGPTNKLAEYKQRIDPITQYIHAHKNHPVAVRALPNGLFHGYAISNDERILFRRHVSGYLGLGLSGYDGIKLNTRPALNATRRRYFVDLLGHGGAPQVALAIGPEPAAY